LTERQALREEVKAALAQLTADGRNHFHPLEPEARRMKVGAAHRFADNAQAVVDGQEGVMVACEAGRQETDAGQLVPLIEQARENLGVAVQETTTLADAGYGAGADLHAAQEKQLPVLAPPAEGRPAGDNPYASQNFDYDPQARTPSSLGTGSGANAMVPALRDAESAAALQKMAARPSGGPESNRGDHSEVGNSRNLTSGPLSSDPTDAGRRERSPKTRWRLVSQLDHLKNRTP
jgi:hypothetical protein